MSNAFLNAVAPKGKTVKFPTPGSSITGIINAPVQEQQATEYRPGGGGPLRFFKDGVTPIMEQIISLDDTSAPSKEEAASKIYVSSPKMRQAIGLALQEAGESELKVGGTLQVTFTDYGVGQNSANPPKLYAAKYKAPEAPAGGNWGA